MPMPKFPRFYPLLFAAFPILSLMAINLSEVELADGIRPLLLAITFGALVIGVSSLVQRIPARAALLASGTVIAFFSYGHLYTLMAGLSIVGVSLGHHRYALPIAGGAWVLWVLWTGWWLDEPKILDRLVRGGAIIAVGLPLAGMLLYGLRSFPVAEVVEDDLIVGRPQDFASGDLPDIYYIVLDGYARADVLSSYYSFDNSALLDHLIDLGFYIAEESVSNYNQTVLSLAASLNMDFVDSLALSTSSAENSRANLANQLKHSRVRNFLEGYGYELIAFETGYSQTEIRDADTFLEPQRVPGILDHILPGAGITAFESMLLSTTGLRAILDSDELRQKVALLAVNDPLYQAHRTRVRYTLDALDQAAERPGPTFTFAHIISPHPPFVFGPNGEAVSNIGTYSLADADAFGGSPEEYVIAYRNQIRHLNTLVSEAIDEILARSERSVVILLQADHGPGAHMVWNSAEESELLERMAILNAYYFPDRQYQALYPGITPINSFRVLLSTYFEAQLSPLPDLSFFSSWDRPLDLLEVTDRLH